MDIQPISCVSGDDEQNSIDIGNLLRNISDKVYFRLLPPGYIFNPTDEELIVEYLDKKVKNQPLPRNKINSVNLYRYNPETLCQMFKDDCGNKEWYFFTPRNRKYKNGNRPNRAAGNGFWKATGADKEVLDSEENKVGCRKALVFYVGKPPKGEKTPWIMHEYRVDNCPECDRSVDAMRLDDWVLCRIYNKMDKISKNNNNNPSSSNNSNSKGKQKVVENEEEDGDDDEEGNEDDDEDNDDGDAQANMNICGGGGSNTTNAKSDDQNQVEATSSSSYNVPIDPMIAPPHPYHPHMWNQLLPPPQTTNTNNIISNIIDHEQQQLLSGSQWQQQLPPSPPYEQNLQHHNNHFLQNYCHLENTTTTTTTSFEVAPALQPSINNAANLHLPHNWQPNFNGNHLYYQHHNSDLEALPHPTITANNIPYDYQHHNSELEAPHPGIIGDNNDNNNNPHQHQDDSQVPQPFINGNESSQAPQPTTNNGNNTTHTKTADDDEDDEEYDTNQFLA